MCAMNLNYAMMTDCEREGMAGRCGKECEGYLSLKCEHWFEVHLEGEPMKQDILCPECAERLKKLHAKGYPGEHIKFVEGRAKGSFICDFGGEAIEPLSHCTAMSVWGGPFEIPFIPWEHNYIVVKGEP